MKRTGPRETGEETDVAVIGAGPVVFQCGMLDMGCHVIDVLDAPGGQSIG